MNWVEGERTGERREKIEQREKEKGKEERTGMEGERKLGRRKWNGGRKRRRVLGTNKK